MDGSLYLCEMRFDPDHASAAPVCMAYYLSALPYLCSPFYCSIGGEFDEVAGRASFCVSVHKGI